MIWTSQPRFKFGELAAIRTGAGASVVLLHGVGLRAEAWNAQIAVLAEQFAIIAPDMAGHGESALLTETPTLTTYTEQVARLIKTLPKPVFVAGHSMGAMIALDLAARYPEYVRGVVALNAIYQRTPAAAATVQKRAASLDGISVADPSEILSRWFGGVSSPESAACHDWLTGVDPAGYKMAYTVFAHANGPSSEALASLKCPALFMTGAEEPNSTPAMSAAMAQLAPQGKALVIADAAHMMPMTHATQVNAALIDFFTECQQ